MLGRSGSWVGNTIAGLSLGRVWLYQDFAAGSGPNLTITDNDNGSGLIFNAARLVDNSAVVTKTTGEPIFSNAAELPAQLVSVQSQVSDAVVLDGTPAVGQGTVRVWYLYAMPLSDIPDDAELAPQFVKEERSEFLDTRFLNSALNLSDVDNAATARGNLGFNTVTAGRVLFGDGTSAPVSDADLHFNTANNSLAIALNGAAGTGATLDVGGVAGGVGLPVVTTVQRDAITPARNGVILYNSTEHRFDGFVNGAWVAAGITDHGALSGLADDDHAQYALLAGRALGQQLKGGTGSAESLILTSTNHVTKGFINLASVAYVDEGNVRVGIGIAAPTYRLHHEATADNYSHGFAMSHALGGANSLWRFYADLNGSFSLYNPNQANVAFVMSTTTGQMSLAGGTASGTSGAVNVRPQTGILDKPTLVLQQNSTQTADLLRFMGSDLTTILAKVDVLGAATFAGLTLSNISTAGLALFSAAGVVSSLTGTSGQTLYHNGTTWAATNRKEKAGKVDIASGATTKAVVFTAARADANYTPIFNLFNSVDDDPIGIPVRIIAISSAGFTAEWDDALPTSDYDGYWGILEHYDPA